MFGKDKPTTDPALRPPLIDETTGQPTTADEMMKKFDAAGGAGKTLKERTEADRRKNFRRKRRLYALTRTVRILKARLGAGLSALWDARDLVVIAMLMLCSALAGYCVKGFDRQRLADFLWVAGSFLGSIVLAVIKVYMSSGSVTQQLAEDAQKENVDDHGRTM